MVVVFVDHFFPCTLQATIVLTRSSLRDWARKTVAKHRQSDDNIQPRLMLLLVAPLLAALPMLAETALSSSHERALRAAGAVEPAQDVYPLMQIVYPAAFVAMVAEAWIRGSYWTDIAMVGLAIFVAAKAFKYWVIATLAGRWTFRVLVPPGSSRTLAGPYRWMRHPNYVAVVGELAGFAVFCQAPIAGALSVLAFVPILVARVRVEERALGMRSR
jgi:methyltransferase